MPSLSKLALSESAKVAGTFPSASGRYASFRRLFDVAGASAGLLLLSPLFCAIAVAIKSDDGGPVFYTQARVGKGFFRFRVYKFRSMVVGAEKSGLLTASRDSRLTRIGGVLRRYKLDELPQLLNVLKGDMQLVGARPEVERYVEMFHPQYAVILEGRPGITDPASLAYRREQEILSPTQIEQHYIAEILPEKLRLSLEYQKRRTFLSDIAILLRTLRGLIS